MELQTEVPQTGTKLRIESDRQFDQTTGDGILRVQGQAPDGGQVLDAVYVELDAQEADLLAHLLRDVGKPSPTTTDQIAQEVLATFHSKLTGRDAAQIAQIATRAGWMAAHQRAGVGTEHEAQHTVEKLAERFERASAKRNIPFSGSGSGNGGETGRKTQQR